MEVKRIDNIGEFILLSDIWDAAIVQSNFDNPFFLSDLIISWWEIYGHLYQLRIYVVLENGLVKGGVPLYLSSKNMLNRLLYIGNSAANLTEMFFVDHSNKYLEAILKKIYEDKDWDILVLNRTRTNFIDFGEIFKNSLNKNYVKVKSGGINASIALTKPFEEIINSLPKRLKQYLRNTRRKAENMGGIKLMRIEKEDIIKYFAQYVAFSKESFRLRNKESAFQNDSEIKFFSSLFNKFASKNLLDAHTLKIGNDDAAISFGYRLGKGFKWILTVFNPKYTDLRPGHLLISELIQECIKNRDHYFDMFSGGEKYYKQQWCDTFVPLNKVLLFNTTLIGKSALVGYTVKNFFRKKNKYE